MQPQASGLEGTPGVSEEVRNFHEPAQASLRWSQAESANPSEEAPSSEETSTIPGEEIRSFADWLRRHRPEIAKRFADGDYSGLTELDLRGADITDADLYWIGQCRALIRLSLYGTPITDAGLWHLSGLDQLERLNLRGTQITAAGLRFLPNLSLQHLHLCHSGISLSDLVSTPPMPELRTLKLNFLKFRDVDVESLNVYPKLRHLEIDDSLLTDRGLRRLLELQPGLTRLEIRRSQVSPEALQAIRARFPHCDIAVD